MVSNEELLNEIKELLEKQDYQTLTLKLVDIFPVDLAETFDELTPDECAVLLRMMPKDLAAEVFAELSPQQQRTIAIASTTKADLLNNIYDELYFDDKIDFLGEMPANFVKTLLKNSTQEERGLINQFLRYPDNSAGSLMTIEYVDLKKDMSVGQAINRIKQIGIDKETIYTCYVLDNRRKLEGIVSLKDLVLSEEDVLIKDIMDENVIMVEANEDQEKVADLCGKYDFMAVPVVDTEKRLIGIITVDDIVDVIEQENTEDFQKMAALIPEEDEYFETGVLKMSKNRIIWLLVLMISATFTGNIISRYEKLLSSAVILTAFIPMLMDSGGNAGSQSSTLIIRGIALGEIKLSDWFKVVWKELRVSLCVGITMAIVNSFRMILFTEASLNVTLAVSLTLLLTVVLAKLVGGILPILAKAVKLDPAIMAGPLITTIVDAMSLVIYFNIASNILSL